MLWVAALLLQIPQNPSPMVEHTRAHPRIAQTKPPGRREVLELGTLFMPDKLKAGTLLFFFHGGQWLPEVAAAKRSRMAVISIQIGAGSGVYARAFEDPERFPRLIAEAEQKSGRKFSRILLGGWSAGCGAIREILKTSEGFKRVDAVLAIDGIHTGYLEDRKPDPANLEIWLRWSREALAGRKRLIITHSEVFPGTFASTTETADWLLGELGLKRRAVLKWGPAGMQQLGETQSARFTILSYAGNSAPDHVDQLHALPVFLDRL
jgi:hypothetical protein